MKRDLLPAALRSTRLYNGKVYTRKDLLDYLILEEGFVIKTNVPRAKGKTAYKLENLQGQKQVFAAKAELQYIDRLLSQVNKGASVEMEHKGTIEKIKKPGIKTKDAAKMIAADHIAEKLDYYDELETAKLEEGGPIQNLSEGTTLKGPSHAKGGIEIQVNNKPVAEAEGGEVVINKKSSKLFCEELSELNQKGGGKALNCNTCIESQKKRGVNHCNGYMANGDIVPNHSNDVEYEFFYKTVKDTFGPYMDSFYESIARQQNYHGNRVFVVEPSKNFSTNTADAIMEDFESRLFVSKSSTDPDRLQDTQFIYVPEENLFLIVFSKKANIKNYLEHGGKLNLPITGDEFEEDVEVMARGSIINKRMKFPKTYKEQAGKYGTIEKEEVLSDYQTNKAIEKMIDAKGIDPANYTSDEKQYLRKYSGYGGIVVDEFSLEEAKASFTEFYTPDTIVRKMWALAYKYGFKDGGNVLEPSVGTGEFLKYMPSNSMAAGYEINKYSYSICKILYPQYNFYLQPFENVFIKNRDTLKNKINDLPKYSLVIGNPPYGDVSGIGMGMGEKQYTNAKNWIEYFILRGLDLTLPGGLLIYIIGTEVANGGTPFLQQGTNKIKEKIAERADLVDAYRLPNGVFDRTDVLSDILVFKKK